MSYSVLIELFLFWGDQKTFLHEEHFWVHFHFSNSNEKDFLTTGGAFLNCNLPQSFIFVSGVKQLFDNYRCARSVIFWTKNFLTLKSFISQAYKHWNVELNSSLESSFKKHVLLAQKMKQRVQLSRCLRIYNQTMSKWRYLFQEPSVGKK